MSFPLENIKKISPVYIAVVCHKSIVTKRKKNSTRPCASIYREAPRDVFINAMHRLAAIYCNLVPTYTIQVNSKLYFRTIYRHIFLFKFNQLLWRTYVICIHNSCAVKSLSLNKGVLLHTYAVSCRVINDRVARAIFYQNAIPIMISM